MNAIVFEHVPVATLPAEWRAKLAAAPGATVTVRIETEVQGSPDANADDMTRCSGCGAIVRTWPTWRVTCAASAPIGLATTPRAGADQRC